MTEATPAPASAGIAKLACALAKAQGAFNAIAKNRTVKIQTREKGAYTFSYADLEAIIAATRPALSANGLSLVQPIIGDKLYTILTHESGEQIESWMSLPQMHAADPKSFGALVSYLRRYGQQSMLNVAADDDVDEDGAGAGNGAGTGNNAPETPRQPPEKPAYPEGQFTANLPLWEKRIAKGTATHSDIIATIETKYVLSEDQKQKINAIKTTAAAPAAEGDKQ